MIQRTIDAYILSMAARMEDYQYECLEMTLKSGLD
jgi:hypothetical protein